VLASVVSIPKIQLRLVLDSRRPRLLFGYLCAWQIKKDPALGAQSVIAPPVALSDFESALTLPTLAMTGLLERNSAARAFS
jgi:hypothetical protein